MCSKGGNLPAWLLSKLCYLYYHASHADCSILCYFFKELLNRETCLASFSSRNTKQAIFHPLFSTQRGGTFFLPLICCGGLGLWGFLHAPATELLLPSLRSKTYKYSTSEQEQTAITDSPLTSVIHMPISYEGGG